MTFNFDTKSISPISNWDKTIFNFNIDSSSSDESGVSVPSGLRFVSAITFTDSNCYINTGIKSAPNESVKIRIQEFGNLSASKVMLTNGGIYLQRSAEAYWMLTTSAITTVKIDANTIYDIELTNTTEGRTLSVGGETISRSAMSSSYIDQCPIILGAKGTRNGTVSQENWQCHIYEYKYYKEGVLTQDLKPCLDEDGTPCFYDAMSGEFFRNTGSGNLGYIE